MTELRTQLRAARERYVGAAYPGDLAADVLPAVDAADARDRRGWVIGWSALTGLAAALVVAAVLLPGPTRQVAQWAGIASPTRSFNLDLPALPSLPVGPELAYERAGDVLHRAAPGMQLHAVGESVRSLVAPLVAPLEPLVGGIWAA